METNKSSGARTLVRAIIIAGILIILLVMSYAVIKIVPKAFSTLASANISLGTLFSPKGAATSTNAIQLPAKRNEWHQTNGVDCGISVCHYMEEELRTARGKGLGNEWPYPVHTRDRLQKYLEQLKREWAKWRLEQHKEGGAPVEILDNEELKAVTKEHQTACQVWAEAHKSPGETIVFEYRCSRCRWSPSGVGCDSCNPLKKLERMKRMHQEHLQIAENSAAAGAPPGPPPLPPPADPPIETGDLPEGESQELRAGGLQSQQKQGPN